MELHGGKILIESTPGEGTVVTCIFPASSEGRAVSGHRLRSNQSARRTRRERTHARSRREFAGASRSQGRQVAAAADQGFQYVSRQWRRDPARAERSAARRDRLERPRYAPAGSPELHLQRPALHWRNTRTPG